MLKAVVTDFLLDFPRVQVIFFVFLLLGSSTTGKSFLFIPSENLRTILNVV